MAVHWLNRPHLKGAHRPAMLRPQGSLLCLATRSIAGDVLCLPQAKVVSEVAALSGPAEAFRLERI